MVIATDAITRAIKEAGELIVSVVPIVEPLPYENVDPKYTEDPVDVDYVRIITYGSTAPKKG